MTSYGSTFHITSKVRCGYYTWYTVRFLLWNSHKNNFNSTAITASHIFSWANFQLMLLFCCLFFQHISKLDGDLMTLVWLTYGISSSFPSAYVNISVNPWNLLTADQMRLRQSDCLWSSGFPTRSDMTNRAFAYAKPQMHGSVDLKFWKFGKSLGIVLSKWRSLQSCFCQSLF